MRDPRLETKTQTFAGPGLSRNAESVCKSFLAKSRRAVNHLVLFRLAAVNGRGVAGGWCDRLALWIPLLDMAARVMRDVIGGRI